MTDLHKLPIVGLLLLLNFSLHAFERTTPLLSHFSSLNYTQSVNNCPNDSLQLTVQSQTICSRSLIEFQTNLRTTNLTWDYGDGTVNNGLSDGQATHAYLEPGNYLLKVTADYGDNCTETQTIPIKVLTSELDFTYQVINNTVTFKADTSAFTSINRYRWTYGDGAVASGLTPMTVYTYRKNGSFTVTLVGEGDCPALPMTKIIMVGTPPSPENTGTACNDGIDNDGDGDIDCADSDCECICTSGSFGCCDDFTAELNVIDATPNQADGSIIIIPSGSSGDSLNYKVIWGITPSPDGFIATGLSAGTYPIEVIDTLYGCSLFLNAKVGDDNCRTIAMSGVVDIMSSANCEDQDGKASITPVGGVAPHRFLWSNGATTAMVENLVEGPNAVTITDARGCAVIEAFEMPNNNEPVAAAFTYNITADSILFTNESTGIITKKQWTFNTPTLILGDKTPLPPPGNYEVCLIVENQCGIKSTSCQTVGIAPACATDVLEINVLDQQERYCIRQPIFLSTNVVAQKYTWFYGTKNAFTGSEAFESGSILKTTSPIYFEAGIPTVKLVVDYGGGCMDSTSILLNIIATDADFTYTLQDSVAQFIADTTDQITDYSWTFSGPYSTVNDTGRMVNYTFPEPGEYTVSLMPIGTCIPHITQKIISVAREITPENTARACSDGIDNDGDGLFDCEDSDCTCLTCPEDIIFTQQIQIDNFPITYPECTAIEGNVIIQSFDDDIKNLEALSQLTAIGGDLLILENAALTSLAGLDNIETIGGDVEIDQNPLIDNLYSFKKLTSIAGTFAIGEQIAMTALFDSSNASGLSTIGGDLLIYGETKLTDLNTFNKITSLGGALEVANQPTLRSLKGLDNLTAINGNLLVTNNAQLTSLSALAKVANIQGELIVKENAVLTTLTGLDNIAASSITKVSLQSSVSLSFCAIQSICDFLNIDGKAVISGNATGCNTNAEIQAVCTPTAPDLFSTYPWLVNMVDTSACTNEKITQYLSNANQIFLYVETANNATLYNENGQLWCASSANYDCQEFYVVVEVLEVWNCNKESIIDADMDGTPAATDPDDNDPCVPDNTVANCNTIVDADMDGTPAATDPDDNDPCVPDNTVANCNTIVDADMDGTPAATDPDDNDPCVPDNTVANCTTNGGGETPDFYDTYPWLTNIIDPTTCTDEKITIYKSSGYIYLALEVGSDLVIYNAQGTRYCSNGVGLNCLDYYKIDEVIETWECGSPIENIDEDMDGTFANEDPDDNDPCVPDNTVSNCVVITIIDEDMDGTPAIDDPDDNDPCTPDNTVSNCDIGGGGDIPAFYEGYPWLANIVDPTNCTDEKITVYKSGGYIYLAIEIEGNLVIYNGQGTRYCSNGVGLNCLDFYTIDEVLETWECGKTTPPIIVDEDMDGTPSTEDPDDNDPCVPDNTVANCNITSIDADMDGTIASEDPNDNDPCVPDNTVANCNTGTSGEIPAFYDDYSWLPNIVDPSNCTSEKITVYKSSGYIYLAIEIGDDLIIYNAQGTRYCSNGVGLNCLDYYQMEEVLETWECGDNTPPTVIDVDMDGTPANEDPDDNDACIPDNTVSNCVISTPVDEDMDGTIASEDPNDNDPCVPDNTVANCDTGGSGETPSFFEDYPWLANLLDPTNCTNEKITVYKSGGYIYLAVEIGTDLIVYNAQGTRYCANGVGLNCLDFYKVDEVLETWECGDGLPPVIIDADMDGTPASEDPDDQDACVPDNTATNCVIVTPVDEDMDGTIAAEDPDDNDPCVPDNSVANCDTGEETPLTLFADYNWLSQYVDPTNCNGDVITVYKSKGYIYLLVETSSSSIVYNETGVQYCVNSTGYDCTAYYTMDEIIDTWECSTNTPPVVPNGDCSKNVGNIRVINCSDGTPFFFIELPNGTIYDPYFAEGLTFDYIDGQTVNFDFVDADFYSPCYFVQRTVILTCIEESAESCICPDINLPVCGVDGQTYKNACEAACAEVEVLEENECGSNIPNFFVNFPWMSNLVDPDNCTTEKITVYQTGYYQYIWVETPTSQKMYFENGDLYCTEIPEFNCLNAYVLDRIVYQWSCSDASDNANNQGRIASTSRTATVKQQAQGFSIAPNPSRGQFVVTLAASSTPQTISVLSINGGVLQQADYAAHDFKQTVEVDVTGALPGLYLVQVRSASGNEVQRLVIK